MFGEVPLSEVGRETRVLIVIGESEVHFRFLVSLLCF